ncbi:MAG: AzlD family protein [Desulfonatronovibrionaceae bacterium]
MPESSFALAYLTIALMALATYFTRAGGLFFISRFNPSPWFRSFLDHVPSSILIAIVVPAVFDQGPAELAAALAAVFTAVFTRNLIASLATGMLCVSLLRYTLPW